MFNVYSIADNLFTPLGVTTADNWHQLCLNNTGVRPHLSSIEEINYAYASVLDQTLLENQVSPSNPAWASATRVERMMILSVENAIIQTDINVSDANTLFVFSTTKGNIELLDNKKISKRLNLFELANYVSQYFRNPTPPIVVSNACISGVLAINIATTLIKRGLYKNIIVVGGDVVSEFILSGFHCFQALSHGVCKPFDKNRDGINLGEAAATVILSANRTHSTDIEIAAGATSNDANHISGPSRTGEGLANAVAKCIEEANIQASEIGHVITHGTATLYNDEMEAKALVSQGLQAVPTNSLKAYYGHTLGAAGILETIVAMQSMKQSLMLKSYGYQTHGVSEPLNILEQNISAPLNYVLKTASGFGGCNAALILKK